MAKQTIRQQINALLKEYEPIIQQAFMASIADIRSEITLKAVVEALQRHDVNAAIDALNLDRAAFSRVENAIAQAYNAGGSAMAGNMPTLRDIAGNRIVVRFDSRNIRAENWLRTHSSDLITRVIDEQRTSIRVVMETALSQGQGPKRTALDIVGRVSRVTGRRTGGLIGLSDRHVDEMATVRRILADPREIRRFFIKDAVTGEWKHRYTTTPTRWDRQIIKAINNGKALDAVSISKLSTIHSNELLALRGRTIARTETLASIHAAKDESFRQGLGKTNYPPEAVTRVWRSAGDERVRHTHAGMNGQVVQGLDTPFQSPSGALLRFPGDTGMGAGAAEVIGCRCDTDYRISFDYGVT